ncbi:MAG: LptF/LptG family permease [Alistipes sp.]|jgi:lipopolysaccharide export system permease protein|nr:LptF/LptG family permease [Alistipes sp.]
MKSKFPGIRILDRYIIRKFLGTWIFSIAIFVVILVVFDYAEKLEDFINNKAPVTAIWLQYYLNFIPFFINQFVGLLTFVGVIFFTSKMAYNTEIVAMLSSGESFRRLMWPYFLSATVIGVFSLVLNLWVIPRANEPRVAFQQNYVSSQMRLSRTYDPNIYRQIGPGTFVYLRNFSGETQKAAYFAIERYAEGKLVSTLEAATVSYNEETRRWTAPTYITRTMPAADSLGVTGDERFERLTNLDTLININTTELGRLDQLITTMNIRELNDFIDEQKDKGSDMMAVFEVERQSRFSYPAAIFILTLIGVSLSSRKVRGGTGLHLGLGIGLCFGYILFSRFAEEFAKGGILPAALSVWMPNIIFAAVAVYLYVKAPK